ncbi:MAG: tetratricopeptide repeat protein, partial [Myxococcales bacterium]|nr:tetratricopeptide repeat protein [Myxococcales bacterium]
MSSWLGRSARFAVLAAAVVVGLATPARADRAAALRHKAAGDAAVQSGAHRRAVKAYLNAITADSTYMPAYGALSTHYLRWRQYRDAAALLARAVRKAPRYANGWYNLAYALRKLNKLNKAVLAYRRYAALRPASADPYYGIGLALKELGDHAGAAESFERYVQLEKRGERQAWVRKARVLAKSERARVKPSAAMAKKAPASKPPAAKKAATPAAPAAGAAGGTAAGAAAGAASGGAAGKSDATIKAAAVEGKSSGPVSAERRKAIAAVRAGDRAASSGRYKHALSYYRAAIAADFSYPTAYDRAGRTLFRLGDFAEAVRIFRVSIRDIPEYHLGWYNLAYALRKSKRPREAIAAYRKFAGLRPHDPDPYFGMGLAYRSLGEKAAAIRAFNRYIALEKRSKQKQWVARAEMIVKHLGGTPATPGSAAAGAVAAAAAGASAAAATPAAPTPPPKKKLTPAERRKL